MRCPQCEPAIPELVDMRATCHLSGKCGYARRFGDLISYQNDGQNCTTTADKVKRACKYAGSCIDMRVDEMLISAHM